MRRGNISDLEGSESSQTGRGRLQSGRGNRSLPGDLRMRSNPGSFGEGAQCGAARLVDGSHPWGRISAATLPGASTLGSASPSLCLAPGMWLRSLPSSLRAIPLPSHCQQFPPYPATPPFPGIYTGNLVTCLPLVPRAAVTTQHSSDSPLQWSRLSPKPCSCPNPAVFMSASKNYQK